MNLLDWPDRIIVGVLGLILLAAIYWLIGKIKNHRRTRKTSTDQQTVLPDPDFSAASPAFEEAYKRKIEEIKKRRQQREATRQLAMQSLAKPATQQSAQMNGTVTASEAGPVSAMELKQSASEKSQFLGSEEGATLSESTAVIGAVPAVSSAEENKISASEDNEPPTVKASAMLSAELSVGPEVSLASANGGSETSSGHDNDSLEDQSDSEKTEVTATDDYQQYYALCDSKAQRILLNSLIQKAHLKPDGGVLTGLVRLQLQAKIMSHRVDFLVNDKLAIDIDRHVYRNTKMTMIRDRMRNQSLILDGYRPMMFSGNQILADPEGISQTIITTARQLI